jgi:small-conductance mechanosensitive channel
MSSFKFVRFAAVCGFISVVTTLGVHLFFPNFASDFDGRIRLYNNEIYLLNRWWIIFHCLLVLIAASGFMVIAYTRSLGFTALGFTFLITFAVAEIFRQLLVIFHLNGMRAKFIAETDIATKSILRISIENFDSLSNSFFGLFILAFSLGNLFFSLSIWKEKGFGKLLSILLLIWAIGSFVAFGNEFYNNAVVSTVLQKYNYTYQPVVRLFLALWLWRKANN